MAEVVFAEGKQASGLATMLGTLLAQNVAKNRAKYEDFRHVDADVAIELTDLGEAVTLSFAGDRCTVRNGVEGRPRVRLRTDSDTLLRLSSLKIGPLGLPNYVDANGRSVLRALAGGRLRIDGMRHLSTLNRVTRLFSVVE
jgi:SCP-2 sterol transfer family